MLELEVDSALRSWKGDLLDVRLTRNLVDLRDVLKGRSATAAT